MVKESPDDNAYIVGIDVGGTFTDLLLVDGAGNLLVEKTPSTPADIASAVLTVLEKAGNRLALKRPLVHCLDRLVHGSTVAANAFLERKGGAHGVHRHQGNARHAGDPPDVPRGHVRHAVRRAGAAGDARQRARGRGACRPQGQRDHAPERGRRPARDPRDRGQGHRSRRHLLPLLLPQSRPRAAHQGADRGASSRRSGLDLVRGLPRDPGLRARLDHPSQRLSAAARGEVPPPAGCGAA